MSKLEIMEHQQGKTPWRGSYRYVRFDNESKLHVFQDGGYLPLELFAKRIDPPAGWYLKRGAYAYEYVRSMTT